MLSYWSYDETLLFFFLNLWGLENNTNKLLPNNCGNRRTDVKSISKYCTPLKAETAQTVQLTNFQQVSSQQCKVTFGSERNKSCYLLWGWRCVWDAALWPLNSELGHGRWEGAYYHQEQKRQQWEQVQAPIQMTLKLGRAWIQALTLLLLSG